MILHDPHALHRKWWDRDWKPGIGDDAWTDWDFLLAKAYQTIQDYSNKETGQWYPYDASSEVRWDVRSSFSGSKAALEKAEKDRGELAPGESLYAVPEFDDEANKPTLASWAKDLQDEVSDLRPVEARESRPPTPEELQALIKRNSTTVD